MSDIDFPFADLMSEAGAALHRELARAFIEDDARRCEMSLYHYLQQAWPVFDPSEFVPGWHLEAIAEHLEAVSRGDIRRLLINVQPRSAKTSLVAIAWPTWTWAQWPDPEYPLIGPGVRFLCASYGANKAQQDGVTARRLIASNWYQRRWGERVKISAARDNQEQYDTDVGGSRISTGIPESLGKGGMIRICFPYYQGVLTTEGLMAMGWIVKGKRQVNVMSWNGRTQRAEPKRIAGWHRNPGSKILRLTFSNGLVVRCTPDHRFLVLGGEWKAAREIPVGSDVVVRSNRDIGGMFAPQPLGANVDDGRLNNAEPLCEHERRFVAQTNLACDVGVQLRATNNAREKRPVRSRILDVLKPTSIAQIARSAVRPVAVLMAYLLTGRNWAYEGQSDSLVQERVMGHAIAAEGNSWVSFMGRSLQHLAYERPSLSSRCAIDDDAGYTARSSHAGKFVSGEAGERHPDLVRLVSVRSEGWHNDTYCISVADNHNMFVGDGNSYLIASNCDDPHKVDEVESEQVIQSQIRAYNEVWRTRSNDPNRGAEVIIMQRLGENDLTGYLLENDNDIVHLCLPTLSESDRRCVTVIGFEDPREDDDTPLWPERFDYEWCVKQRKAMGEYAWASQFQQIPAPRGGGIVKREHWQIWPPVGQEDKWTERVVTSLGPQDAIAYPPFETTIAYLDTAFTEKEENAYSACVSFGVFEGDDGRPKVLMDSAWQARCSLQELVMRVMATCKRRKVDTLIIENKAGGIWVKQELTRLMREGDFSIVLDDPKGDKVARLHSVTPLFEARLVYAPDRDWADLVITQVSQFPKGRFKDLVDCVSAGLGYLRRSNLIRLQREYDEDERESRVWRGNRGSVAERYGV
jgi:predicted phage terminase large subunit-like protein